MIGTFKKALSVLECGVAYGVVAGSGVGETNISNCLRKVANENYHGHDQLASEMLLAVADAMLSIPQLLKRTETSDDFVKSEDRIVDAAHVKATAICEAIEVAKKLIVRDYNTPSHLDKSSYNDAHTINRSSGIDRVAVLPPLKKGERAKRLNRKTSTVTQHQCRKFSPHQN